MSMPSLSTLETFLAVARHRSFRKASAERGVSPSALSHVIRDLEENLGVRLFNRTNRSIHITQAGETLAEGIGPALRGIADTIAKLQSKGGMPCGLLRLNVPRVAADLVVKPVIGQFLAKYPDIRLEVVSNDGLVDIVAGGFDAGIRPGRLLAQDMIAVQVGPRRRFAVVASPAYLAGREPPRTPSDLHAFACVERAFPNGSRYAWEFSKDGEILEVAVKGPLVADDSALLIQAALEGIGLAHVFESHVTEHISEGRLVRFLEDWCPVLQPFYVYYPGRRQVSASLRAFIDIVRTTHGAFDFASDR